MALRTSIGRMGRGAASARSSRLAVCLVVAVLALTALPVTRAQEPAPKLTINQADASQWPRITAFVTALDARGVPEEGLAAAQFHAFDGQQPLTVESAMAAQDESLPLTVVIAMDVSGSMEGAPLEAAKAAAAQFVQSLAPQDQATLMSFSTSVTSVVPFTSDRQALAAGIGGLRAVGGTSLFEAAQTAVYTANAATSARKAVVLLTDGQNDSQSPVTAAGALDVARQTGLPVFSVGFGGADEGFLRQIADATQGAYSAASPETVGAVYARVADLLRKQYALSILAPGASDGAAATLRIVADIGGAQAEAEAAVTRGVAPPPLPTAAASAPVPDEGGGGSSATLLIALAAVAGAVLVGGGGVYGVRRFAYARAQRQRERVAGRQSDEELPEAPALTMPAERPPEGQGRLIALNGASDADGEAFVFGAEPVHIGSAYGCGLRLPHASDVAPEHALIYMRNGKMVLRALGGAARPTIVGTRAIDLVILDDGDEIRIGGHTYRAERVG